MWKMGRSKQSANVSGMKSESKNVFHGIGNDRKWTETRRAKRTNAESAQTHKHPRLRSPEGLSDQTVATARDGGQHDQSDRFCLWDRLKRWKQIWGSDIFDWQASTLEENKLCCRNHKCHDHRVPLIDMIHQLWWIHLFYLIKHLQLSVMWCLCVPTI